MFQFDTRYYIADILETNHIHKLFLKFPGILGCASQDKKNLVDWHCLVHAISSAHSFISFRSRRHSLSVYAFHLHAPVIGVRS